MGSSCTESGTPQPAPARGIHSTSTRISSKSYSQTRSWQHCTRCAHDLVLAQPSLPCSRVSYIFTVGCSPKNITHSCTNKALQTVVLSSSSFRPERKRRVEVPTVISTKRIAQLAKKWQRMAALGRKRLIWAKEACNSAASKGHCTVYTTDGARFEVPLACLGTAVFAELLRMSQEEFDFAGSDGRIMLPCDAAVMEYAMCLLSRGASAELEQAFLSTMAMPCHYANRVVPYVAACC